MGLGQRPSPEGRHHRAQIHHAGNVGHCRSRITRRGQSIAKRRDGGKGQTMGDARNESRPEKSRSRRADASEDHPYGVQEEGRNEDTSKSVRISPMTSHEPHHHTGQSVPGKVQTKPDDAPFLGGGRQEGAWGGIDNGQQTGQGEDQGHTPCTQHRTQHGLSGGVDGCPVERNSGGDPGGDQREDGQREEKFEKTEMVEEEFPTGRPYQIAR